MEAGKPIDLLHRCAGQLAFSRRRYRRARRGPHASGPRAEVPPERIGCARTHAVRDHRPQMAPAAIGGGAQLSASKKEGFAAIYIQPRFFSVSCLGTPVKFTAAEQIRADSSRKGA
ncbi:hypothetical protein HPB50_021970 [Hyalomma asiaticum]|uniref:Uncharacterized protein n=1 Tax=Hyalomma asiaticum TaxID=266040 RepID=A0ACB7TLF0_HYAAI|nr:hypothetical protein HPB50_021970 [Hyalomma asiaticum]